MEIQFYNVKTRLKVSVPLSQIRKTILKRQSKSGSELKRYALRAVVEGTKLIRFVTQKEWESLEAPIED